METRRQIEVTTDKPLHVVGLDTVRAFAALSVMFAHILGPGLPDIFTMLGFNNAIAGLSKYLFTGHPAVIVFFVVSGFCIHYPYTRRQLPVLAFTLARWTRIMIPALIAMLFAQLLGMHKYNFIDGFILWSIVCELWYYSLYPLLLVLSRKVSFENQFIVAFAISLIIVIYLGSDQYGNAKNYGVGLNWFVALPSWLLGCVLANRVAQQSNRMPVNIRQIVMWRASVAVVASILYWLTLNTFIGYYLTMNFFAVLVVFWINAEIRAKKDKTSLFEKIGKWSYSIYLFHIIIFSSLGLLFAAASPFGRLLTLPLALIGCYVAYKLFEEKSHQLARYIFKKIDSKSGWNI
ncbi:MAG: acyltransferase family protein [Methylophilaceae bacterium]